MRPSRLVAPVLVALVLATPATPRQDAKPTAPPPPTVAQLAADLGHPLYAAREKAQRELWNRGDEAIPALEKALKDENPEVVRRARELLDKFAWGVRPDTPEAVLKLLKQFQAGDPNPQRSAEVRKAAILELLRHGPAGMAVARAMLGKNLPDEARTQVVAQVTSLLRREVPLRLFEGKRDEAAELIALHAAGTGPEGAADYAAFQFLAGNVPAAAAAAEADIKANRRVANNRLILANLYRASGDWEKARAAAADIPREEDDPNLIEHLREEEGDWAKLAETGYATTNHPDAARLSLLRLAGRQKDFDELAKDLVKAADDSAQPDQARESAIALFANQRAEDATRVLLDTRSNLGLLGEVLIQRLRYKDALDLLASLEKPGKQLPAAEKRDLDLRRARVLMLLGRRDEAVQVFNSVADRLRVNSDGGSPVTAVRTLIRTEIRVGLRDLAAEHAARFYAGTYRRQEQNSSGETLYELLFGQDATVAESIFAALRAKKIPGDDPGATMIRTRELVVGKASRAAVDEALAALRDAPLSFDGDRRMSEEALKSRREFAVAAVCRGANREADALAAFQSAAELTNNSTDFGGARSWVYGTSDAFRPYADWGDFLFDRGRFREAADVYLAGWKKFPEQPLTLYLSGKALVAAGDAKEGERRKELAHWVGLGQERIRGRFLDDLVRRGEGKAATRETQLILRACWCRDHFFGNVMNQAAKASALVKDFALAEKCSQRSLLVMLKTPGMYYVEVSAYMVVPHEILVSRARAAIAAGKVDEAMKAAREALAVTPGHVELVSGLVPQLEKLGKKAEADELFAIAWDAYQKLLAEFPDSPAARNGLAALAANCRRELDKGLAFAQDAVRADPGSIAYRDTLAEVCFRSGDRTKAAAVMGTLIEDDPRNRLYRRQLVRYRGGALDSPKPDTED